MSDLSPAPAAMPESLRVDYVPRPGLLRLSLVNAALTILTLTLYRFWARTNVRRHIWSCVHINGLPLEYTGKGSELFKGALFVTLVFGLPALAAVAAVNLVYGPEHPAVGGIQGLLFIAIYLLWGAAIFRARRYQLSRTLWRGIRGALEGSATTYSLTYFGALLARGLTFGWLTPLMNVNLQQQLIGGMRFGDMPFRFRGRAGPLYPSYALCWFLSLAILLAGLAAVAAAVATSFGPMLENWFSGTMEDWPEMAVAALGAGLVLLVAYLLVYPLIWSLYTARELAAFAGYTRIGDARFALDATAGSIVALALGNALLWIFTLGVARPYIQQRLVRYLCDRIRVDGTLPIGQIRQSTQTPDKAGEGLADAFDVGGL